MFRRVSKVLAAVSGGADSVACLLVLLGLRERFGFEVEAVHFDHKLRPESAADMDAVRKLCANLDVECVTGEGDVAAVAAKQRQGIEETARMMRYQFLAFAAGKEGADCIATGHTADDQAETILMRIARGSGVRGIRGMLPVAGVPGAPERRLVRPLLGVARADTEAICAEFGITPIVDPSNADLSYTRNRVRGTVLEQLRELNPSVEDALRGLAESAREAFSLIEKRSFEVQPRERGPVGAIFALGPFRELPSEALTLVIEREAAFYHLKPDVNRTRVANLRAVLAKGTGTVHFGDTVVERIEEGHDTVQSAVTWVLSEHVENLTLTGPGSVSGTGNELGNVLIGNAGSNVLIGLAGNAINRYRFLALLFESGGTAIRIDGETMRAIAS